MSSKEEKKNDKENRVVAYVIICVLSCAICFLLGADFNSKYSNALSVRVSSYTRSEDLSINDWYDRTLEVLDDNNCSFISTLTHYNYADRSSEYDYLYCNKKDCNVDGYCKYIVLSLESLHSNKMVR